LRSAAYGHPAPLQTLVDEDLLAYDEVWAAAGTPSSVFPLTPAQLVERSGGVVARVIPAT
jgi:prolyl-tRNA editing enzyme YbaK/EbsC (Cys-tRNA(Pro) deacylase)